MKLVLYSGGQETSNRLIHLQYSRKTKYPIFACTDGSGTTINENRMTFIGKVLMFSGGKKVAIF